MLRGEWSELQIATLRELYETDVPIEYICHKVGRKRGAVHDKAGRLGLKRPDSAKRHTGRDYKAAPWLMEDYEPKKKPSRVWTLPAGPLKIDELRRRFEAGEQLWHEDDCKEITPR